MGKKIIIGDLSISNMDKNLSTTYTPEGVEISNDRGDYEITYPSKNGTIALLEDIGGGTETNEGYSAYSYTLGYNCQAGVKGYLITASDSAEQSYTLDGELPAEAIGKIFSARIYNNYLEQGEITNVQGNKITVTNHVHFYTGTHEDGSTYFYVWNKAGTQELELDPAGIRFWISSMPGIGSHDFGHGAIAIDAKVIVDKDGNKIYNNTEYVEYI